MLPVRIVTRTAPHSQVLLNARLASDASDPRAAELEVALRHVEEVAGQARCTSGAHSVCGYCRAAEGRSHAHASGAAGSHRRR